MAYHDVCLYFPGCITDTLVISQADYFDCTVYMLIIAVSCMLSHDGISKVLMGSSD